ncbi:NUDIX domain-containing protein [Thermanaerothrix sp. 4228-RoL]|uniref:NUDIX domain-containing protein n=1 Tax=Thermanaerothrix solaris TaxID=3058434 RepID=A0ABU3NK55_9CHLR|nr:NUDIX domain-containing protein [Thermanaerothrix sp. 4228-RoL]MDT8897236.1 NUDIX domain-containing protein [Thermanaerothrix sp. 4228-RoL]
MGREEQGVFRDRYTIIPRTLIFITHNDKVLLLKGAPHKRLWAGLYNGIGGHVEQGEGILAAAKREVQEETGLEVANLRLCGVIMIDTGETVGIGLYVFRGDYVGGEVRSSPEGNAEWIAQNDVNRLPLVSDLYVLLPRVLRHQEDEPPFVAHYYYDDQDHLQVEFETS